MVGNIKGLLKMERIKQALEMARKEREKQQQEGNLTGGQNSAFGKVVPVDSIAYKETKTVQTPNNFLRNKHIISADDNRAYIEAYKILSTQVLQRMQENKWNVLGVTSPTSNNGKSLTAINLGISLAKEMDYTVLLVDADLRHPKIHSYFNLHPEKGLSDYLKEGVSIPELLINPEKIPHFVILPGGKSLSNSSEMLGSPKMSKLVEELKNRYPSRIVIFDLPPLLSVADAIAFAPYVDATLLVVEDGVTKEEEVKSSLELLKSTNVIGTVLNKAGMCDEDKSKIPGWFKVMLDMFKSGFSNRRFMR